MMGKVRRAGVVGEPWMTSKATNEHTPGGSREGRCR